LLERDTREPLDELRERNVVFEVLGEGRDRN
jgi:hypothetical protein